VSTTVYVGIDNGVTGSIAAVDATGKVIKFCAMPTFKVQDYTKKKKRITRVDTRPLISIFNSFIQYAGTPTEVRVFVERPMINPQRFIATTSALRALEATLIILEHGRLAYRFLDSREWQSIMLPQGIKGADDLKRASLERGLRLYTYPALVAAITKQKDADSLLMAEAARKEHW